MANLTHYENTPIQIYRKFHLQKTEKFQIKKSDIFQIIYTPVNPSFII